MHKLTNEQLLALWLEDKLTPSQRTQFEQRCTSDPAFSSMLAATRAMAAAADEFAPMSVPHWDPGLCMTPKAVTSKPSVWWQGAWLPLGAMAMSALAMVLSLTNFSIHQSDAGLVIGFAKPASEVAILAEVDTRLAAHKAALEAVSGQYLLALQEQQAKANATLTAYLLETSREQRREDFAELVQFINQQRADDQLFVARQLKRLQQNLLDDVLTPAEQPIK